MPERDEFDAPSEEPSKTELKRRMTALQELGETLAQLPEKQLAKIPIEDERLLTSIREVRRIRSNSARRRHMQYIGKLMRDIDPQPMQRALDALRAEQRRATAAFHDLEQLRDSVLAAGPAGAEQVLQRWAHADRQLLRQLVLQHQREQKQGGAPAAGRKLFKYLRELQERA